MSHTASPQAAGHAAQPVRTVHLIFKTHLDVGFTDYAAKVVERYFTGFIPQALATARALRQEGGDRFVWTTGSWLVYEALERAEGAERDELERAVADGDIVWHALPFTTHSELMDSRLFELGLSLSAELDRRFGRRTRAAKMTDVPGHTRAIVPLLAAAGVDFLHIGVNGASHPPDVPELFRWQAPGGAAVTVMYQFGGYGDLSVVPGLADALAFAHTGDNLGPQSPAEALGSFAALRARLPGASVVGSTLDAFAERLAPAAAALPAVAGEIGDTWVHGVGTDPVKVARFRELLRLRDGWLASGRAGEAALRLFGRRLLMVPEHTWGMDEKTHLADDGHYRAEDFAAARQTPRFQAFEASWAEQRAYVDAAVDALPPELAGEARDALAALAPRPLDMAGFEPADPAGRWSSGAVEVGFDPDTGAIGHLREAGGREWAGPGGHLALFRYQTFSAEDYARFRRMYNVNKRETAHWSVDDYTKPGIERAGAVSRWWLPSLRALWRREDAAGLRFVAELAMPEEASRAFGCPPAATLEVLLPRGRAEVALALQWLEKPACRLPEALWCSFTPRAPDRAGWRLEKMGQPISPLEVVRHGGRRLHAVGRGARYEDRRGALAIDTLDAPLVAPGEPSLLNFTARQPPVERGVHINLLNNVWGTNFPMWFGEPARFRFALRLGR